MKKLTKKHDFKRRVKYVPTTVEMYPCFSIPGEREKLCRVSLSHLTDGNWRVSIWGADDCGWEYDTLNRLSAEARWSYIERVDAIPSGFVRA